MLTLNTNILPIFVMEFREVPVSGSGLFVYNKFNQNFDLTPYADGTGTSIWKTNPPNVSLANSGVPDPYINPSSSLVWRQNIKGIEGKIYFTPSNPGANYPTISHRYVNNETEQNIIISASQLSTPILDVNCTRGYGAGYSTDVILGIVHFKEERKPQFVVVNTDNGLLKPCSTGDSHTIRERVADIIFAWAGTGGGGDTPVGPNWPGPTNTTGGGQGDRDNLSDIIPIPSLDILNNAAITKHRFLTLYNPNNTQLREITDYLWGTDIIDRFSQLFPGQNPMDYIISLHSLPVTLTTGQYVKGRFYFGGSSRIQDIVVPECNVPLVEFVDVVIGTFSVKEYFGNFADYDPYTSYYIYLPFIGYKPLSVDQIMGKTIRVLYRISLLTGNCVVYITNNSNQSVIATFAGTCLTQYPISADQSSSAIVAGATAVSGLTAIGLTSMGAVAPGAALSGFMGNLSSQAANTVGGNKSQILTDGNLGPAYGIVDCFTCYLVRKIPNQSVPTDLRSIKGYTANISKKIGEFTGFTQFSDFHLEGLVQSSGQVGATRQEIDMISNALREGVIL